VYRDPVLQLEGVDAVVDKDRTAAILATELQAALLLILTDVPAVYRDYGTDRAARIPRMTVAEAESLLDAGQFGSGSMRPKVEAAVAFARNGGRAIIAELSEGLAAIRGETGTTIVDED
jgi:carbamate kinase